MATRAFPREPTAAEAIFVAWLADRTRDFGDVVRDHPRHSPELRALHALWLRLEPVLALAGIRPADAVERLAAGAAPTPLDLASKSAGSSATTELLRRLEKKRRASRYRFEGEVARGGMGAILRVWDEDIRRHLAMKVVLGQAGGSGDTPPVESRDLARFLEEAQITGQLDHPGIVPVHELGLDAEGRVYFTMKLVKGRDLGAIYDLVAARREGWTETRALGVLQKVCEAVAYAHAKDVIHRDLKPANVMVGDFGEVYVMDWGLARVLGRAETRAERVDSAPDAVRTERVRERESSPASYFLTMDGEVVGTPAYMPPEQARGDIEALSARSDVYALGAMLYHLLAGSAPYTAPGENAGGRDVWKRAVAGPPPPIETLAPQAPSELVAICDKAMAREPADRYASVQALAEDLRAFLEGRVVGAFEGGALAEARKWVRRNKPLAAALAAAVVALAAGLVASLVLADRVRDAAVLAEARRVDAERNAAEAQRQARVAQAVNSFLNEDVLAAVAPERAGIDVTVREVLDQASRRLDARFAEDPTVEAALRSTIGTSYGKLGVPESARLHHERALELHVRHDGPDSEPALLATNAVAAAWSELGRRTEAIALLRRAAEGFERLHGAEHRSTIGARIDLAGVLADDGHFDEARALYATLEALEERVLAPDDLLRLTTRNNRALLDRRQGRFAEAADALEDVLEMQTATHGDQHPETLTTIGNLAGCYFDLGRFTECEALARRGHALSSAVLGPDHPSTGMLAGYVGHVLLLRGDSAEAEPWLLENLDVLRAAVGEETEDTQQARTLVAGAIAAQGRLAEAADIQLDVLLVQRRTLPTDHPSTLNTANSLAIWLLQLGRLDEAEPLFRETLEAQARKLGPDHPSTIVTRENLGNLLREARRLEECAVLVREVLEARKRVLGDEHPDIAKTSFNLGLVTWELGDAAAAKPLLEDAMRRLHALGPDAPLGLLAASLRTLGDIASRAKDHDRALECYGGALEELRATGRGAEPAAGYLLHQIGITLLSKKDHAGALAAFEEAAPLRITGRAEDEVGALYTRYGMSMALLELGRHAECERILLLAHADAVRVRGPEHAETQRVRKLIVDLYERWGRPDEAAPWR